MGEAVARVARKVNDTVENKTDSLGKAGSPSRLRLGPGQGSGIREQGSIFHCHRLKKAVGVPSRASGGEKGSPKGPSAPQS